MKKLLILAFILINFYQVQILAQSPQEACNGRAEGQDCSVDYAYRNCSSGKCFSSRVRYVGECHNSSCRLKRTGDRR